MAKFSRLLVPAATGAAIIALCGMAHAGDPSLLPDSAFGQPVGAAELDSQRGKALPDCASGCTLGDMTATLYGNTSTTAGASTATNVIGDGALANSGGAFVAVQNIGNNVIIQTNMAVDVNFVK